LGEELEVVWELEPGTSIHEKSTLPDPTSFDDPQRLQAFLDAVTWGAISQSDDRTLHSPFRSGIEIDDYQLDPVVRALSMPRVNLLIADDVGLGKTIEAGLVVQEMILRHRVRSVLIVCPSSLQLQWRDEMRDKFGLEFRIVDSESISQLRRKRGIHVNPWEHFPRLITSIDFLKRERPLRSFRETLRSGGETAYPRPYDLLIVDEAHNVAPSGRGQYATESMRTLAIRVLTPNFEHKLFLSATPHNGYRESFAALLELLDNQRFARAISPDRAQLDAVMVRRMKNELKLRWDGGRRFAERRVKHLEVPYTQEEREGHRALQEYTALRTKNASTAEERFATVNSFSSCSRNVCFPRQRPLSSLWENTSPPLADGSQWLLGSVKWHYGEDYESETSDAVGSASQAFSPLSQEERKLLKQLTDFAARSSQRPDSKTQKLVDWLNQNLKSKVSWNTERVIIFTEYRATQKWLYDLLARHDFAGGGRLELIYGGMPSDQRERIKAAFQASPADAAVRILLARRYARRSQGFPNKRGGSPSINHRALSQR